MKKIIRLLVIPCLLCIFVLVKYVNVEADTQTTELTMSMESTYTLTVPAKTSIKYGIENTTIGNVSVSGNISSDSYVEVSAVKNDFVCGNKSFSFNLLSDGKEFKSGVWEQSDAANKKAVELLVNIPQATWDTVETGEYTGSIVFEAELKTIE